MCLVFEICGYVAGMLKWHIPAIFRSLMMSILFKLRVCYVTFDFTHRIKKYILSCHSISRVYVYFFVERPKTYPPIPAKVPFHYRAVLPCYTVTYPQNIYNQQQKKLCQMYLTHCDTPAKIIFPITRGTFTLRVYSS